MEGIPVNVIRDNGSIGSIICDSLVDETKCTRDFVTVRKITDSAIFYPIVAITVVPISPRSGARRCDERTSA